MKKYTVYGTTTVCVSIDVAAESEDEAIEKAYEARSGLTEYCGNGGCDKLVGVEEDYAHVETEGNSIDYGYAEETDAQYVYGEEDDDEE